MFLAYSTNILWNGGFEESSVQSWAVTAGTINVNTAAGPPEGNYCGLHSVPGYTTAYLYQRGFTVVKDVDYYFHLSAKRGPEPTNGRFCVRLKDYARSADWSETLSFSASTAWSDFSGVFRASGTGSATLDIQSPFFTWALGNGAFYVDDFRLIPGLDLTRYALHGYKEEDIFKQTKHRSLTGVLHTFGHYSEPKKRFRIPLTRVDSAGRTTIQSLWLSETSGYLYFTPDSYYQVGVSGAEFGLSGVDPPYGLTLWDGVLKLEEL